MEKLKKEKSLKKEVQTKLLQHCKKYNNYIFNNELVKRLSAEVGFGNPFDVTKIDSTKKLSILLKKEDYFILHLGGGKHKFVKGIKRGYHRRKI